MKRFLAAALSVCALCVLSACGGGNGANSGGAGGGGSQVATHFAVSAPSTASVGTIFGVGVLALNASNQTVLGYTGTVHFTSSDPQAVLSGDSVLTNGSGTFSASLASPGNQTITATDTARSTIKGISNSIDVADNSSAHGFQVTGEMGTRRAAHTATLLANGKVLITGGFNSTAVLATAELFDPVTGTFTATGTMGFARCSHTATLLANGKVLITGGSNNLGALATHSARMAALFANGKAVAMGESSSSDDLATAELFDPVTGTFTATGAMSEVRSEHTATLLADGKVLVACGTANNVADLFDPATGSFTATGQLIVGGRWGCTASLLNGGKVLIAGGRDAENVFDAFPLNNAELFNPATGEFAATGEMTDFRYGHTATLLENGKVLLAGGTNGNSLQDAELFDPTAGAFSVTGAMSTARSSQTATLLNDGTVLVAGGFTLATQSGGIATAELFDTGTNMFTPTGRLSIPRFLHTATRLNSGKVLVTGGQTNGTVPIVLANSAEVYE